LKVLFFLFYNKNMTGGPRVLLNLLEQLVLQGIEALVVLPEEAPITRELSQMGVAWRIHPAPPSLLAREGKALEYGIMGKLGALKALFRYNRTIHRICREDAVDVIWTRNLKGVLMTGAGGRWSGTPVIWDVGMETRSVGLVRILHAVGLWLVNQVVLEGDSQHRQVFGGLQRLFGHKMMTINPGIPPDRIQQIREAREQGFVTSPTLRLISIGSITPRKNQHELIEVARLLLDHGCTFTMNIVGPVVDAEYGDRVHREIETQNLQSVVKMLGWRDDVAELLATADILLSTSLNEGIPYVIHEAMHAELPIIAYPVGGIPDAVVNQKTGVLIPDNSPVSMARAILQLQAEQSLLWEMGRNARDRAVDQFAAGNWGKHYLQVLNVLSSKKKQGYEG
jgi:glycosyltransferase involved in cell wall biosynthesis